MGKQVAVLFARSDSIYKQFDNCDVYDIDRDARSFAGGLPIVAHPPCRAWGRLRAFAKPRPGEKDLALFAVDMIRKWGGYWNTRKPASFGKQRRSLWAWKLTNTEGLLCPSINFGGAIEPGKGHGFI